MRICFLLSILKCPVCSLRRAADSVATKCVERIVGAVYPSACLETQSSLEVGGG